MPITIRIGDKANQAKVKLELDIRKSLNGDLMIFDHGDIDIILSASKNKIVAFPKDVLSDVVYGAQNRLFAHLMKKGIVLPESIQGGAFYGAMEAKMETPYKEDLSAPKMALINISRFIDEERPYFEAVEMFNDMEDDNLVHPDKADSTELGEVPQRAKQGSIRQSYINNPYGMGMWYQM